MKNRNDAVFVHLLKRLFVPGLLAVIVALPAYSDSKLKVQQFSDELIAGEVESWHVLLDQSTNSHTIIQSSISALAGRAKSNGSQAKQISVESDLAHKQKLNLLFECNPEKPMHFSLRYPFDIQSGLSIRYRAHYAASVLEGGGEKLAELDKVSEQSRQTYGLKDMQIIRITDDAEALASMLQLPRPGQLQIELLDGDQVYVSAEFNPAGFDQAFEFACAGHPRYKKIAKQLTK